MNSHTFDGNSVTCPICHRSKGMKLGNTGNGLYMCPYCQECFVVSQSGNYVRDPQPNKKQKADGQMLRRQSRPLARMRRDFQLIKPIFLIAIVSSAILFGYSLATLDERPNQTNPVQDFIDWATKMSE
ncbi:MAG TPA: hypothetical protein V6D28_14170 [Leptolyngbyaceae cyanobacterium]